MKALRYWMYLHKTTIPQHASMICREIARSPIQMMWCTTLATRYLTWIGRRFLDRPTLVEYVRKQLEKIVNELAAKGISF